MFRLKGEPGASGALGCISARTFLLIVVVSVLGGHVVGKAVRSEAF